jgi:SAM-dependent methyltransferase
MEGGARLSIWPVPRSASPRARQAFARRAIEAYSESGELVLDPMCGVGATLIEAIALGRRAVGVELDPRQASRAAASAVQARSEGATGQALVMLGDGRRLGHGLCDELVGQAALVLTSPRSDTVDALAEILESCARMLRPDGQMVLIVRQPPRVRDIVDLTDQVRAIA